MITCPKCKVLVMEIDVAVDCPHILILRVHYNDMIYVKPVYLEPFQPEVLKVED